MFEAHAGADVGVDGIDAVMGSSDRILNQFDAAAGTVCDASSLGYDVRLGTVILRRRND